MDKKNFTIGALLLVAAFALIWFGPKSAPPANAPRGSEKTPEAGAPGVAPTALPGDHKAPPPPQSAVDAAFAAVSKESADATVTILKNSYIEARFTNSGGALRDVALIKRNEKGRLIYPEKLEGNEPFVFNQLHSDPILALVDYPGLDRNARYELVAQRPNQVEYRAVVAGQLEITRRYTLSPDEGPTTDPYQIRHETIVRNISAQGTQPFPMTLALGTSAPANANDQGLQLTTGYSNGEDRTFIPRAELEAGGGFLGIGAQGAKSSIATAGPIVWGAVKNQFFTSILTGDTPASALVTRRVKLLATLPDEDANAYGISGAARFDVPALAAGSETKVAGTLYVGPKEYARLANPKAFKHDEDKVMDFGFFRFFSQILLWLMTKIHSYVGNWGVAIILTTLTLKTFFIPFTLAASRSAKRMAKLQPEMQAIREKYKDNPQKQQQATMELFKTRKINPVGGCIPILLTIPFFMGFFTMLQSAAELRFQPFLWAPDLASPDTIAVLFGIVPLNIMPLLMGATMVVQMHITPSPSVDNMQMKMMKFMPYIFTLFCYSFSCALSLYSFINGLFTIGQQLVINRMKDPVEPAPVAKPGKPVKNVTPTNKRLK